MLCHRKIDRVCCAVLACTLLLCGLCMAAGGSAGAGTAMGYEGRLFDRSRVHTIDIVMDGWEAFLSTCTDEEYTACHVVIDGESVKNVGIRAKGNTSLSSVAAYGNNRYSFKVEFDHYQKGKSYHGLDKLSLNNIIQDNTYMKDYLSYTLMSQMGVPAPLCSFVQVNVNGEAWGLYLAVEGVEESFLRRNYGRNYGELYKPDSMSFGAGRGNGRDFDMDDMAEKPDFSFAEAGREERAFTPPDMGDMPAMPDGFANGGEAPPDMGNVPAMPEDSQRGPGGRQQGGFQRENKGGGMGSDDVKLLYADDDPASYANIFDNAKTDVTDEDKARLIAAIKALNQGDTSVVDTDEVLRYMVVHNFLCNGDSYTGAMVHNYYLYEKDGVLSMIPWDYNLAFGGFDGGSAANLINGDIDQLVTSGQSSDRPMAAWITASEEAAARYHQVYQEFISQVFDSGWFARETDRVIGMIAPYVAADPTAFCTYEEFQTGTETLKAFCLKRAESVTGQLAGSTAQVDAEGIDLSAMGSMNRDGRQETPMAQPAMQERIPQAEAPRQADGGWEWLLACSLLLCLGILAAWRFAANR